MPLFDDSGKVVESGFKALISRFWDTLAPALPMLVQSIGEEVRKNTPSPVKVAYNTWLHSLVTSGKIDTDTAHLLGQVQNDPFPMDFLEMLMIRIKVFNTELENMMSIYGLDRQYSFMALTTPNPAPVDNLIRSMILDPGRSTENRAELKKYGFDDTQIENIILSYYRTIDEGTLRECYLRGIITEERLYERMRELGYTDTRTQEIVQTWEVIPGPQDLFTMVAKEAFEPDMYQYLGLSAEFPEEQLEWLEKQGISRYWAQKYWISHWDQPSIGQGFEMLHRGVIDRSELDLLFRAVEIPSFWRDRLTQIAYQPFTRVDVRRMHEQGVLTDEQLLRSYMDLGYDSEKALAMAEFTIRYNLGNDKELTRSTIVSSYEKGLIDRATASDLLTDCGYSEDLADYYLTYADYNQEKETQDILFDNIKDRYLINQVSESEVRSMLNSMGMSTLKIDAYIDKWDLTKYKYQAVPTKEELDDWLTKGIITESQWRDRMHQRGYNQLDVQRYFDALGGEGEVSGRLPTKADLTAWLKGNIINGVEFVSEMRLQNYSPRYIRYYLQGTGMDASEAVQLTS